MIGSANTARASRSPVSAATCPARVVTNDDLSAQIVDTSDEWIRDRTGIRERRIATQDEAVSDIALPAVPQGARDGRRRRERASTC